MKTQITHNGRYLIAHIKRVPGNVEKHISVNLHRGVLEVQRAQRDFAPKAESLLVQAIQAHKINELNWEITAATNYATAVEKGTAPGSMPPVQAVLDWIKRKHITPNTPDLDELDLAFIIQRTIQTRGIKAQPYMQPGLDSKRSRLGKLMDAALQKGLHGKK